jgi:hypothetical protein
MTTIITIQRMRVVKGDKRSKMSVTEATAIVNQGIFLRTTLDVLW